MHDALKHLQISNQLKKWVKLNCLLHVSLDHRPDVRDIEIIIISPSGKTLAQVKQIGISLIPHNNFHPSAWREEEGEVCPGDVSYDMTSSGLRGKVVAGGGGCTVSCVLALYTVHLN